MKKNTFNFSNFSTMYFRWSEKSYLSQLTVIKLVLQSLLFKLIKSGSGLATHYILLFFLNLYLHKQTHTLILHILIRFFNFALYHLAIRFLYCLVWSKVCVLLMRFPPWNLYLWSTKSSPKSGENAVLHLPQLIAKNLTPRLLQHWNLPDLAAIISEKLSLWCCCEMELLKLCNSYSFALFLSFFVGDLILKSCRAAV